MLHVLPDDRRNTDRLSPLMLSDRLIALAQQADNSGFVHIAEQLLRVACAVFETGPSRSEYRR
ncbi:MAG TPA: hypothetical protein VLI93_13885 [Acetobacteraceae bacterium]|nr:hypothetical protein [Acetobacteraceae bacterium]